MAPSNSERGRAFRDAAKPILEHDLGTQLSSEVSLPIGRPPKEHKFDLVAQDKTWILECKNLAWRENGGVPHAKITSISEAAGSLLQCAHQPCRRALVLSRATHPKQRESLAEYYVRLHAHNLAADVGIVEVDTTLGSLRRLVTPQ
jgi:hypothetical protein